MHYSILLKKTFLLVVFTTLFTSTVFSQYRISGKVTDAQSGDPLPYVSVYLSGSTSGAQTDTLGNYSFSTQLIGQHELVASFVGFISKVKPINLSENTDISIDFELEENIALLDSVVVTASNSEWRSRLFDFLKFFIGEDKYSEFTFIENPEVISFSPLEKSALIKVTADSPLEITNNSLGYKMWVLLDEVEFNPNNLTGFFKIYPRFEVLPSDNPVAETLWKNNRKSVYKGSSRHFFKSLYEEKIKQENFVIEPSWGLKPMSEDQVLTYKVRTNTNYINPGFKGFYFDNLGVYVGHDLTTDRGGRPIVSNELTQITPGTMLPYFFIDRFGLLMDPRMVTFVGNWEQEKVSRLLPFGYLPE